MSDDRKYSSIDPNTDYTEEEMRALFAQQNQKIIEYWSDPTNEPEATNRVEAAVHTVLASIDGDVPGMPGFILTTRIEEAPKPNEDGYIPGLKNIMPVRIDGDLVGDLEVYNNPVHPLATFRKDFNALFGFDDSIIPDDLPDEDEQGQAARDAAEDDDVDPD